jgi:UDP-N-acetylglucosamine 2-epimerase (non-hydrolysing)
MSAASLKVLHVVGARPNFMKVAPIVRAMAEQPREFEQRLVHTGQHYDEQMSQVFFDDLGMPQPDVDLGVGSGTHAEQTAKVMLALEPVLVQDRPDWILVAGDVNSTAAAALTAAKLGIKVGHVESGLRSFDRTMPEELNRVMTDHLANALFTHSPEAGENLAREGIALETVHFVGNTMIDTLVRLLPRTVSRPVVSELGLGEPPRPFALVTLHRPSNVDDPGTLDAVVAALGHVAEDLPVVFPVHPRTRARLGVPPSGITLIEPVGYLDFLALERFARMVITDSGGVQEETTFLGVPCLTLRPNTERPVTILRGTNQLVTPTSLVVSARQVLAAAPPERPEPPELWDGRAADRIVSLLPRLI